MKKDYSNELFLVSELKKGNKGAFTYFYNKYRRPVYYSVLKKVNNPLDAEDIIIETFSKVFMNIDKFVPVYKLNTWVSAIANNLVIDHYRSNGRKPQFIDIENVIEKPDTTNPETELLKKEKYYHLDIAKNRLNKKYKAVITLLLDGNSYIEISQKLNLPMGTVKVRISRAKKLLLEEMK